MEEDDIIIIARAAQIIKRRQRRPQRWIRSWIQRRQIHEAYHALMQELSTEHPKGFQNFLRMGKTDFQELLAKVTSHIQRQNTWMREAIHVSAAERLSITLRYLATGDSYHSLEYLYRIPVSTVSTLIPEICQTIYDCLKNDYLKVSVNTCLLNIFNNRTSNVMFEVKILSLL